MDVRACATNAMSFLCDEAPARLPLDESLRLGRCVGAEMAPQGCPLAAARRRDTGGAFLIWSARNSLKRPESDEGIQDNPNPFSWSGLVWIWFGFEEFGLRRPQTLRAGARSGS